MAAEILVLHRGLALTERGPTLAASADRRIGVVGRVQGRDVFHSLVLVAKAERSVLAVGSIVVEQPAWADDVGERARAGEEFAAVWIRCRRIE